jgi:hypothetical protein
MRAGRPRTALLAWSWCWLRAVATYLLLLLLLLVAMGFKLQAIGYKRKEAEIGNPGI